MSEEYPLASDSTFVICSKAEETPLVKVSCNDFLILNPKAIAEAKGRCDSRQDDVERNSCDGFPRLLCKYDGRCEQRLG